MKRNDSHFDRMLISYVEQYPCLYDEKHTFYKDREKARRAWITIADRLERTVEAVEARWKALKKSFTKVCRVPISEGHSCKRVCKKTCTAFPLFEYMLWLRPYIKKSKMKCTNTEENICPVHGTLESSTKKILSCHKTDVETQESDETVTDVQDSVLSSEISQQKSCQAKSESKVHLTSSKNIDDKFTQTVTPPDSPKKLASLKPHSYSQCSNTVNADLNFMMSVVSDMQMISQREKIVFKREVMQLLEKYILKETK